MRRLALLLLALALAGCAGDENGAAVADGMNLVLAEEDVGAPFVKFDEGEQERTDMAPPRDDPARFNREGGWKARFQRGGGPSTVGPLVIESRADLFESAGDASDDFALYQQALDQLASGARGTPVALVDELGEESYAVTFRQGVAPSVIRHFVVAWRQGNVTASLNVNGFDGKIRLGDVVELARKQEARIEDES